MKLSDILSLVQDDDNIIIRMGERRICGDCATILYMINEEMMNKLCDGLDVEDFKLRVWVKE